jgi:hypothetical protein
MAAHPRIPRRSLPGRPAPSRPEPAPTDPPTSEKLVDDVDPASREPGDGFSREWNEWWAAYRGNVPIRPVEPDAEEQAQVDAWLERQWSDEFDDPETF